MYIYIYPLLTGTALQSSTPHEATHIHQYLIYLVIVPVGGTYEINQWERDSHDVR